jgi:hypothetical protein
MRETLLPDDRTRDALRLACAALDAAEARGQPVAMCQALADVARCYRTLRAWASAETSLQAALRWARASGSPDLVVDLLCELCDASACLAQHQHEARHGSGQAALERARDHAFEAGKLAARVADANWEIKVLLRISDVLDRCGDRDDAVLLQTRALRLMARNPSAGAFDPAQHPGLGRLADG